MSLCFFGLNMVPADLHDVDGDLDTFIGCSGVVVKGLSMSKTCQIPRAFMCSAPKNY